MKSTFPWLRRCMVSLLCYCPLLSLAGTTTAAIFTQTAQAIPACLNYRVKGVCFWLFCTPYGCSVKTSIRVEHFVPDAVMSIYHDPKQHPWIDYGQTITNAVSGFGSTLVKTSIDSAGTRSRDDRTSRNHLYRDGDAVGHPLATLSFLMSGSWPSTDSPSSVPIPNVTEMMKFPSTIPTIIGEWASVPSSISSTVVSNAKSMADLPSLTSQVMSGMGSLSSVLGNAGSTNSLSNAMTNGVDLSAYGNSAGGSSSSTNGMPAVSSATGNMSTSGMDYFCLPAATPFGLYFQSHLDALTWRNILPAELLYPGAWIPGLREIGQFPANSWSGVYPRDGNVIQPHIVKGPAVLAQRMGDIITRSAQPHLYQLLSVPTEANGFRYFHERKVLENAPHNTLWQRIYPHPEKTCQVFGQNDSVSLVSWGDGHTSPEEGYIWNMWRLYDCCAKKGQAFLFSIP